MTYPRGCARETLKAAVNMDVQRIIYISCDPGTLSRDLAYSPAKDYRLEKVQPVDMFPWTCHVESIVLMSRVKKD